MPIMSTAISGNDRDRIFIYPKAPASVFFPGPILAAQTRSLEAINWPAGRRLSRILGRG